MAFIGSSLVEFNQVKGIAEIGLSEKHLEVGSVDQEVDGEQELFVPALIQSRCLLLVIIPHLLCAFLQSRVNASNVQSLVLLVKFYVVWIFAPESFNIESIEVFDVRLNINQELQ